MNTVFKKIWFISFLVCILFSFSDAKVPQKQKKTNVVTQEISEKKVNVLEDSVNVPNEEPVKKQELPAENKGPKVITTAVGVGAKAPQFMLPWSNAKSSVVARISLEKTLDPEEKDHAKVVLISFFATWCKACKKELPFLVQLQKDYQSKGLQIFSISIDKEKEEFEQVKALIAEHKIEHPVLKDQYLITARRYLGDKTVMPTIFVVNSKGIISFVDQGYDGESSATLIAEIEKALNDATP